MDNAELTPLPQEILDQIERMNKHATESERLNKEMAILLAKLDKKLEEK